jgi:hypothetical protein
MPPIPGYHKTTIHGLASVFSLDLFSFRCSVLLSMGLRWLLLQLRQGPHLIPSVQRGFLFDYFGDDFGCAPVGGLVYDEVCANSELACGLPIKVRSGIVKMAPYIYMYSISVLEETGVSKAKMERRMIWKYHATAAG